jgi:TrkA domain protein
VAVIRGEQGHPAPGPDFVVEPKDTLVVVGTSEGIKATSEILTSG